MPEGEAIPAPRSSVLSRNVFLFLILPSFCVGQLWVPSARQLLTEPTSISSVVNQDVLLDVGKKGEVFSTPFFFHIPKTGGTTIQDLVSFCLGVVTASEIGIRDGHDKDKALTLVPLEPTLFVNVDVTSLEGMARAQAMGFAKSGLARLVFTPFLPQATNALFDNEHKASVFALFRHPVERAISLFYYLQYADWEPHYHKEWINMTLMEYLDQNIEEHNWMVRILVGKYTEDLDATDLEFCKELVSKKILVGLTSVMHESIDRFGMMYAWDQNPQWNSCKAQYVEHPSNSHRHPKFDTNSPEWKRLLAANHFDHQLYLHAVDVFEKQRKFFDGSHEA